LRKIQASCALAAAKALNGDQLPQPVRLPCSEKCN
jgi:hypothetical protein